MAAAQHPGNGEEKPPELLEDVFCLLDEIDRLREAALPLYDSAMDAVLGPSHLIWPMRQALQRACNGMKAVLEATS